MVAVGLGHSIFFMVLAFSAGTAFLTYGLTRDRVDSFICGLILVAAAFFLGIIGVNHYGHQLADGYGKPIDVDPSYRASAVFAGADVVDGDVVFVFNERLNLDDEVPRFHNILRKIPSEKIDATESTLNPTRQKVELGDCVLIVPVYNGKFALHPLDEEKCDNYTVTVS